MSNRETFVPLGLVDLIQNKVNSKRKQLDDLEERMHSALDAKRDAASAMSDELQEVMKRNQAMWQSGYEAGIENGDRNCYDAGYKAGRDAEMKQSSEQRDRDLLEEHGIDVDGFCDQMVKLVKDHEQDSDWDKEKRRIWNEAKTNPSYKDHDQDVDEDEPDQYQPEQEKWGGTK